MSEQLAATYVVWRDALAAHSLADCGQRLLEALANLLGSRDALDELAKQASDGGAADAARTAIAAALSRTTTAIAPTVFRGASLLSITPAPLANAPTDAALHEAIVEVDATVRVVSAVDAIRASLPSDDCKLPAAEVLKTARERVRAAARRPVDWLFLRACLGPLWAALDAVDGAGLTPSQSLAQASAQANETGWFADTHGFDVGQAIAGITMGMPAPLLETLGRCDSETRARMLEQLDRAGFLDPLLTQLGWADIKFIHDHLAIGHAELKSKLQTYFIGPGKWGPTLGEEWATHETSPIHYLENLGPLWTYGYRPLFGGAIDVIEQDGHLQDAHTRGEMSDAAFERERLHLWARTAVVTAASFVTGGVASKIASFGVEGIAALEDLPATARGAISGGVGGAAAGAAGTFTSDVYNIYISGQQDELSSLATYAKNTAIGAGTGAAAGASAAKPAKTSGDASASESASENASQTANNASTTAPAQAATQVVVSTPGRVTEPVPGLFDSIDPANPPKGWQFTTDPPSPAPGSPGYYQVTTFIKGPAASGSGSAAGWVERWYNPTTKTLVMKNVFADQLATWVDTGGPGFPDANGGVRGVPLPTYLTLFQMKVLNVGFGEPTTIKMATIENIPSLIQLHTLTEDGLSLDEAVAKTQSVSYGTTAIQQAGLVVDSISYDSSSEMSRPLRDLLEHYERSRPDLVAKHDEMIAKYGNGKVTRDTVVRYDYNIIIKVRPWK